MVPAGQITDTTIAALADVLEPGDIVIDGGNTHYHDDLRHAAALRKRASTTSIAARAAGSGASIAATV